MATVLKISGAEKRFGSTRALCGPSLALERGECLGLVGPNGAGKTTLVDAIAGRVRLDRGTIRLLGQVLPNCRHKARRKLGVVPQDIALYPSLTAEENLTAFGVVQGVSPREIKSRVSWALDWTGLADRAKEPIRQFSGGMKRRLNIAASVLHRPEVLLMDEPTVGVDPQSRQRIWEMLEELRFQGASLLLTTHQLDEAERVCDRIVIIDRGRVARTGTPAELVAGTIGTQRQIVFCLNGPPPPALEQHGFKAGQGNTVRCSVDQIATKLPEALSHVVTAGGCVEDIRIEVPSLQAAFLHLTGRELRE